MSPGEALGQGTDGLYFRLRSGPDEPRRRRLDLAPESATPPVRRSLLHFVFITDIHTVDVQSPGRFEFMDRFHGGPDTIHLVIPSWRPQEVLNMHAFESMIRTVNAIEGSPVTGAPIQLAICGGDNTDNKQWNELDWFLTLTDGGIVSPSSNGSTYEGVQAVDWDDLDYWHPDPYPDLYKTRWGFPEYPGLLEEASRPFRAEGFRMPWLSCFGNHDALVLGTATTNPTYEAVVTGSEKPLLAPHAFDPKEQLSVFNAHPEEFLMPPVRPVSAVSSRRTYSRREFVEAHLQAPGQPAGHGFTHENLEGSTAYYVKDCGAVRLIFLDTTNPSGDYRGSLGASQRCWLEQRLIEIHSRYFDAVGNLVETGNDDRLAVIVSHHNIDALINDRVVPELADLADEGRSRVLGPELEALVHRFPNVVLWINGHIHRNQIVPRADPSGRTGGFWEVTTSSIIDWPCQSRLFEIVSNTNGTISVFCTVVDNGVPADPSLAGGLERLSSIHRELAGNDPHEGFWSGRHGAPEDRTVELLIPAPFPID